MNSFSAVVPIANLQTANDDLEAQGHGANNFSVKCYTNGVLTHYGLHAWGSEPFGEAVVPLMSYGVQMQEDITSSSSESFTEFLASQGLTWGAEYETVIN